MIKFISYIKSIFNSDNDLKNFVLYKIIDRKEEDKFVLQCINSKSIFEANLLEIISESAFLNGLHPLQACFIGIEYALYTKKYPELKKSISSSNTQFEYGEYLLIQKDRNGQLYFKDINSHEEFVMKATDLIFNDSVLSKFHAEQAFHIGIYAGKDIHQNSGRVVYLDRKSQFHNRDTNSHHGH